MLAELILYVLTPTKWQTRKSGLLTDSISLWARARRCRDEWQPHEKNCHAIIHQAINRLTLRRTVMVVGSGLLRDVPINALTTHFDRVILVDAVHLLPVRLKSLLSKKVKCIEHNLLDADKTISTLTEHPIDLIISANVLSQLPLPIVSNLPQNATVKEETEVSIPIIEKHLQELVAAQTTICLLTDVNYIIKNKSGEIIEQHDLLYGKVLPQPNNSWQWRVCPFGEEAPDKERIHTVNGYISYTEGT